MSEEVRYERIKAAAVLTIDRPAHRNAVDMATAAQLREGLRSFEADGDARVLVLTGAGGKAFCAGFDLKSAGLDVDDPSGPMGFTRLTQRLPRTIGMGRALELILTGRPVEADEALRIGLVNEMTEPGAHLDRALELAERLASFPQEAMLADRRAAIEGFGLPLEQGLDLERRLGRETLATAMEGAAKFAAGEGRHGQGV